MQRSEIRDGLSEPVSRIPFHSIRATSLDQNDFTSRGLQRAGYAHPGNPFTAKFRFWLQRTMNQSHKPGWMKFAMH